MSIENLPEGVHFRYFQVTDGKRYLSNCVKFEYQYARDFADLLGDLPAIGGRSFEMQLSNVKKGETIKLYADLGGSCDLMLAESVVTEEEAETNAKKLVLSFPETADWDSSKSATYDIYQRVNYLDELDPSSDCSGNALGTYELDLTPPGNPSGSIVTSTPNKIIKNPEVSGTIAFNTEDSLVSVRVYANDETCSDENLLYKSATTDTASVSYSGSLITDEGDYELFIESADIYGNESDCVSIGSYRYDVTAPHDPDPSWIAFAQDGTHSNSSHSLDINLYRYHLGTTVGLYTDSGCSDLLIADDISTTSVDESSVVVISDGGLNIGGGLYLNESISFSPTFANNTPVEFYIGLEDTAGNKNCISDTLYKSTMLKNVPSSLFSGAQVELQHLQ